MSGIRAALPMIYCGKFVHFKTMFGVFILYILFVVYYCFFFFSCLAADANLPIVGLSGVILSHLILTYKQNIYTRLFLVFSCWVKREKPLSLIDIKRFRF